MHLQGKELVSLSTQRSARALTATALVIVLAKHYAVLPTDLELVGVTISQTAVSGAIFWIVGFQVINHVVHWWGDYRSIWSWNSSEKVNGVGRMSAGSHVLSKLDKTLESIGIFLDTRKNDTKPEGKHLDVIPQELISIRKELSHLKPSIESYRTFGTFYFFGWFLAFPILIGIAAIFWQYVTGTAISPPSVPFD
jgi:hypothetical protein